MASGKEYAKLHYKQLNVSTDAKWVNRVKEYCRARGMGITPFVRMVIDKEMMLNPIDQYLQNETVQNDEYAEEEKAFMQEYTPTIEGAQVGMEAVPSDNGNDTDAIMKAKREIVQAIVEALQKSIV